MGHKEKIVSTRSQKSKRTMYFRQDLIKYLYSGCKEDTLKLEGTDEWQILIWKSTDGNRYICRLSGFGFASI